MVANPQKPPSADFLFNRARERASRGDSRGTLRVLFDLFCVDPLHQEGLQEAARISTELGAKAEATLFSALSANPRDAQALYDLGYTFVEQRMPEMGARYLSLCAEQNPDHALVQYELGVARYLGGEFDAAVSALEKVVANRALAGPEPLAAALLLVKTHIQRRDLEAARGAFNEIGDSDEEDAESQLDAASKMLARADCLTGLDEPGPRGWHFIENGGVLLHTKPGNPPPLAPSTAGIPMLAGLIRRLETVLRSLEVMPSRIQYHSKTTRPFALAIARFLGIEAESFTAHPQEKTLVVIKDPAEAKPIMQYLRDHEESVDLFSVSIDPRLDHAISPEIVGVFAQSLDFPWEANLELNDGDAAPADISEPSALTGDIPDLDGEFDRALNADNNDGDDCDSLGLYYLPLKDSVILGNYGEHPARRVLTAHRLR